ncbi:MAG TPA: peptidylprolyl isomerase [Gemmatimonadales bacterium]|nr:peptidylprolyl isomerase [Gemmatimonadales bacterium]
MVRRFAVLFLLGVAGCAGLKDALTAHQDVVARAAGQELAVNRLAAAIAPSSNVPLRRDIMDRVADLWVNWQLLGQAVAGGDSLLDSATMWAANWPQVTQRLVDRLHDTMIVSRAHVTPRLVDSAYNAGDARWLDHILISVPQTSTPAVRAAKLREAEGCLAQLRRGADFARLAHQKSNDTASARNGGSLGLVARGQMVKPFEAAAWSLKPGEYSGVVESPYGYHIIWRPQLAAVRDSFAAHLHDLVVRQLDSLFVDSLNKHANIKVKSSAPAAARFAAQNMREAKRSGRVVATYTGGRLTEADLARWMQAFGPQTLGMIGQAPDSTLSLFVKNIARNAMLIHTAQEEHIQLTKADRDSIRDAYRADLSYMIQRLGVSPESLATDTAPRQARAQMVARRVQAFFDDIITNSPRHQFFDVQPYLADVLRSRYPWSVSPLGVDRALAKAQQLRGPATPTPAPASAAPSPTGPTQPAPGGPPMSAQPPARAPEGKAPAPSRPKARP